MSPLEQQLQRTEAMVAELRAKNAAGQQGLLPMPQSPNNPQGVIPAQVPAPAPNPAPVPAQQPVQDPQAQMQAMVRQALPQLDETVIFRLLAQQLMAVFKKALSAEDLIFYVKHIQEGAPGIAPFLASPDIQSLAQLINETYRDFLRGKPEKAE